MAMTNCTTDEEVICVFFSKFSSHMTRLRGSSWKNDTVIVLDNAAYHKSALVRRALSVLKIRVVLSGPYSF